MSVLNRLEEFSSSGPSPVCFAYQDPKELLGHSWEWEASKNIFLQAHIESTAQGDQENAGDQPRHAQQGLCSHKPLSELCSSWEMPLFMQQLWLIVTALCHQLHIQTENGFFSTKLTAPERPLTLCWPALVFCVKRTVQGAERDSKKTFRERLCAPKTHWVSTTFFTLDS